MSARSTRLLVGLAGVSVMMRQMRPPFSLARARARSAASATAARSWPAVKLTALTPKAGSVLSIKVSVPPYKGWLIKITSPGRTCAHSAVEMADMPLENTAAVSPCSQSASRSSSTSRLGLLKRE